MRKELVEAGAALIAIGLVLLLAPELLAQRELYPMTVACIGISIIALGILMFAVSEKGLFVLKVLSSALYITGTVVILLGVLGVPILFFTGLMKGPYTFSYRDAGPVEGNKVHLEIQNPIGNIVVGSWKQSEYLVEVTLNVQALSQKAAEQAAESFKPIVTIEHIGNKTMIKVQPSQFKPPVFMTYDVRVTLPQEVSAELSLQTSVGSVKLRDIFVSEANIEATTGQVIISNVKANSLNAKTTTGTIEAVVDTKIARISTTTGKIELSVTGTFTGEYILMATTGKISISVPEKTGIGVQLEAISTLGDIEYPKSWITSVESVFGPKSVTAKNPDFDSAKVKIIFKAEVTTGKIEVTQG